MDSKYVHVVGKLCTASTHYQGLPAASCDLLEVPWLKIWEFMNMILSEIEMRFFVSLKHIISDILT